MKIITSTLFAIFLLAAAGYGQEAGSNQVIGFGQPKNAPPGKQFLYVVDSTIGGFWRIDLADGTVFRICQSIGGNSYFDWDSKGNLYACGNRTSPDGKRTPFIQGLVNPTAIAIDSHDNLYFNEYQKHAGTYKLPLGKVTEDMLPITVIHTKDASGKVDITVPPEFKPAGLVTQMQMNVADAYSLTCDAWDNIYFTQNPEGPVWKYSPEGKVTKFGLGSSWARYACPAANGEFYHLGGDIIKGAANGQRIGWFSPSTDRNHSIAIDLDAQGNLYEAQPSHALDKPTQLDEQGTPVDLEHRGIIYKYTPDGRRSVLGYVGFKPWGIRVMPKNKYPTIKPAE